MSCDVGEVTKLPLLHLRHSSFSNPPFASPTSQDFPLRHLTSRPCRLGVLIQQAYNPLAICICLYDSGKPRKEPQPVLSAPGFELGHLRIRVHGDEFRSALCSVHLKSYYTPHFTVGVCWNKNLHLQPLQRCYCENSRSPATARVITLSRARSRFTKYMIY